MEVQNQPQAVDVDEYDLFCSGGNGSREVAINPEDNKDLEAVVRKVIAVAIGLAY